MRNTQPESTINIGHLKWQGMNEICNFTKYQLKNFREYLREFLLAALRTMMKPNFKV